MYCYSCYAVMDVQPQTPMHQEPSKLAQPDKVFYFAVPHNCEKPESFRPCHSLNPYRHRHYAPEVYSCYVLDKPPEVNILLFLLYCYGCTTPNPHAPGTFNSTQTDKVFYFGVPHNLQKPEGYRGCHNLNGQDSPGAGMLPRTSN